MSKDAKIERICDHSIVEEQVQIDSDLKTIRIPRVLASQEVDLRINSYLFEKTDPKFGWNIEEDETAIYTKKSKIVLKNKRKATDDFFHISYNVPADQCPKCFGLKVINDESYSKLGKLMTVENEEKLLQEIKKGISTELNSNPFHEWIGTEIYKLVGSKAYNISLIRTKVIQEISRYIEKYVDVQNQQAAYQAVTLREAFGNLITIDVYPEDVDPSYWTITIIFSNATGSDLLYEKRINIPSFNLF